jgi:DNA-binding HxlR family transcriptional regulator/putative sterol carrier protein
MTTMRSYDDGCAVAHTLDLVGERWALLVVRELVLGPKRFTDLRTGLPKASPNVLAQRLRELERSGIVRRRKLPPPAGSQVYELTDWGRDLEPIVAQLGRWGSRSPYLPQDAWMSVDALILGLRTQFSPHAAGDLNADYELRLGEDRFRAVVADGRLELVRGNADRPDAAIESDSAILKALVFGGLDLAEAVRAGDATIEGDQALAGRFLTLFPLPEPVASPEGRA